MARLGAGPLDGRRGHSARNASTPTTPARARLGWSMSARPTLSVVIAVYERPRILELVLQSLDHQTWTDFEIVLADDGSSEAIGEVARAWAGRFAHPIRRTWQPHHGFRKTLIVNRAVRESSGGHLVFI